jgi:ribonuclease HII
MGIYPTDKVEQKMFGLGYKYILALDEVGVGCLAGPVVACAVLVDKKTLKLLSQIDNVRDSKLLTYKQREEIFDKFKKIELRYQICYSFPKTIDKKNILMASLETMKRAVKKISRHKNTIALIDGPHELKNLQISQKAIIKGDRDVFLIACASIVAKVHRDRMMVKYAKRMPNYGFEKHKGYGTKLHLATLAKFGPCAIHRRSFTPVNLSLN